MGSSTRKQQEYEQAKVAYMKQRYEEAAEIIEKLVQDSPHDPEILLLRGHIYCYFQDFEGAKEQYHAVLENTDDEDYIENAKSGLKTVQRWQQAQEKTRGGDPSITGHTRGTKTSQINPPEEEGEITGIWSEEEEDWEEQGEVTDVSQSPLGNPFADLSRDEITAIASLEDEDIEQEDHFPRKNFQEDDAPSTDIYEGIETDHSLGMNDFDSESVFDTEEELSESYGKLNGSDENDQQAGNTETFIYTPSGTASNKKDNTGLNLFDEEEFDFEEDGDEEFLSKNQLDDNDGPNTFGKKNHTGKTQKLPSSDQTDTYASQNTQEGERTKVVSEQSNLNYQQVESSLQAMQEENPEFIVDDLPTGQLETPEEKLSSQETTGGGTEGEITTGDQNLFANNVGTKTVSDPSFDTSSQSHEPVIEQEQGVFAFLENASLAKKRNLLSGMIGIVSAAVVATGSFVIETEPVSFNKLGKAATMGLVGGITSAVVSWGLGTLMVKQIKRSTGDLQAQLYAVKQGNLEAKATVYSQDEFGTLATEFNQMTRVVSTTTNEAQRKAQEQEQAKEDLQRQVIRLLDDVEGAARGDLTVQAQVSADVLGAVADAFNLTIRNLRTIVQQVKQAARQVNEGAAESASFAQGLSEDALQQAEELAVSLNSAQMMTDSIQRVARNAKEAESVARSASETALKGGEAVDSTVAGILQIRETVAQSTRKVKRLAESSQEISKIVSVISTIATRTNNLALNASIEAARAGEAGQRFTIIADEVRQLADRSTKSLREIEKIVLQIQSETSSVMIAMEEGTQQVIEGTDRAQQAKNALDDIIKVSNHIDDLVQSITADTVEQSETAEAVAQVMQSVEMTAQGTSQESQQVSTALQNLVSLAGDLLASVERFRISPDDEYKN